MTTQRSQRLLSKTFLSYVPVFEKKKTVLLNLNEFYTRLFYGNRCEDVVATDPVVVTKVSK